jgi:hypothetical protein
VKPCSSPPATSASTTATTSSRQVRTAGLRPPGRCAVQRSLGVVGFSRHHQPCSVFELGHAKDVVEGRPVLLAGEPAASDFEALEHRSVELLAGAAGGLAVGATAAGGEAGRWCRVLRLGIRCRRLGGSAPGRCRWGRSSGPGRRSRCKSPWSAGPPGTSRTPCGGAALRGSGGCLPSRVPCAAKQQLLDPAKHLRGGERLVRTRVADTVPLHDSDVGRVGEDLGEPLPGERRRRLASLAAVGETAVRQLSGQALQVPSSKKVWLVAIRAKIVPEFPHNDVLLGRDRVLRAN